jgi:hypothetical protein
MNVGRGWAIAEIDRSRKIGLSPFPFSPAPLREKVECPLVLPQHAFQELGGAIASLNHPKLADFVGTVPVAVGQLYENAARPGATGRLLSSCDADTLKTLGATERLAARALFLEVPDRDNPQHA